MAIIGIDGRSLDVERTGIGRYLENLVREWAREPGGHHFRVYGMKAQALPVEHRVVAFEQPDQPDLFTAELLRSPVDVFFSPLYELPDAVLAPAVITVHDLIHEATPEAFNEVQLAYLRQRHQQVLPRATRIITDSCFARDEIAVRFPHVADRVHVVPLAADPRFTPGDGRDRLRAMPEVRPPFILYVGAISARRHVPALIEALASSARLADRQICVIGRNYLLEPEALSQALALLPPARRMYRPYVSNDELLALYREAEAFVYLSTYEGFGMPPLEAMSCGTPVVVADAASLPEVVGDAAVRVRNPRDVDEIRAALESVLEEGHRAERVQRGLAQAARFSWRDTAARTLAAIEGACPGSASRSGVSEERSR